MPGGLAGLEARTSLYCFPGHCTPRPPTRHHVCQVQSHHANSLARYWE